MPWMKKSFLSFILILWFLATPASAQDPRVPEAGACLEPGVQVYKDLAYVPNGGKEQRLDIYVPEKPDGPLPLIVWIHGGFWRYGDKQNCKILPWMGKGHVVASINYRLCERAKFPAQIQDCRNAIEWLWSHAESYRIDRDRIAVWGSSAGGHLAALVGTTGDLSEWNRGQKAGSWRVKAVIDWYGRTDLTPVSSDPSWANSPSANLLGGSGKDVAELARKASPIMHISRDDPPFLIMHGDKDGLVPVAQSHAFADALKKAGVKVTLIVVKGAGHGGEEFLQPAQEKVIDAFLKEHLGLGQRSGDNPPVQRPALRP